MRLLLTSGLLWAALCASTAEAGFVDAYSVGNWSGTLVGNDIIDTSGAPNTISLTSDDSGVGGETLFEVLIAGTGNLSFNWNYSSSDPSGPFFDPFGYKLNGVFFQLSDDLSGNLQSGHANFAVASGDLFAFSTSSDGIGGSATTTLSSFDAPAATSAPVNVAAPYTAWLLILGFAGMVFTNCRNRMLQRNL